MSNKPTPSSKSPHTGRLGSPPFWMVSALVIAVAASLLPLALFMRARYATTDNPRVQFIQDMGSQPKYKEQQTNPLFNDGRADRPVIPGTVARGQLDNDDHYYRGYSWTTEDKADKREPKFYADFPQQVKITPELLARGRDRFVVFCAPCHGWDGAGHGPINERAAMLAQQNTGTKWIPAADLHGDAVRERPAGHIFNTITHGIRSMPPYAAQIGVHDRWAIVAYVRALQLSEQAPVSVLSADQRKALP